MSSPKEKASVVNVSSGDGALITQMLSALRNALWLLEANFDPPSGIPKAADTIIPQVRAAIQSATRTV